MPAKTKFKELGFSLIELLIVIAIIGVLVTMLVFYLTQVQKNGRDAKRQSDLQTVAGALRRFYSDNGHFPPSKVNDTNPKISNPSLDSSDCSATTGTSDITWGTDSLECGSPLVVYLKQLPHDPRNDYTSGGFRDVNPEYCYISNSPYNTYDLYAWMEVKGNTTAGPGPCPDGRNYNYRVTPND